jgi:hypothetical protein
VLLRNIWIEFKPATPLTFDKIEGLLSYSPLIGDPVDTLEFYGSGEAPIFANPDGNL